MRNETKTCEECRKLFMKIKNKKTDKIVPVNIDSLSAEDWALFNNDEEIFFRSGEHISHFKTCTDPNRFSSKKKENKP